MKAPSFLILILWFVIAATPWAHVAEIRNDRAVKWRSLLGFQQEPFVNIFTDADDNLVVRFVPAGEPPKLRKYSPQGMRLWERELSGYGSVHVTETGELIHAAPVDFYNFRLAGYSQSGDPIWSSTNSIFHFVHRIAVSQTHLFLIGDGGDLGRPRLVACDRAGLLRWVKTFEERLFPLVDVQVDPRREESVQFATIPVTKTATGRIDCYLMAERVVAVCFIKG